MVHSCCLSIAYNFTKYTIPHQIIEWRNYFAVLQNISLIFSCFKLTRIISQPRKIYTGKQLSSIFLQNLCPFPLPAVPIKELGRLSGHSEQVSPRMTMMHFMLLSYANLLGITLPQALVGIGSCVTVFESLQLIKGGLYVR